MSPRVRIDDHVYERIKASKRDDESFSEAIERLISEHSFQDLQDVFDDEEVDEMRDAIERADNAERE
jgi:predicted CopG family antitoxin